MLISIIIVVYIAIVAPLIPIIISAHKGLVAISDNLDKAIEKSEKRRAEDLCLTDKIL